MQSVTVVCNQVYEANKHFQGALCLWVGGWGEGVEGRGGVSVADQLMYATTLNTLEIIIFLILIELPITCTWTFILCNICSFLSNSLLSKL